MSLEITIKPGGTLASWKAMIQRCTDPNYSAFRYYGGRGIKVCARWMRYPPFAEDMGHRPDGATLDRIDTTKGYEPGNCRWATWTEQQNNKRNNRRVTHEGRTQTVAQWAREKGLKAGLVIDRLDLGWTPERALETPPMKDNRYPRSFLTFKGETLSKSEWADRVGISLALLSYRLSHNWSVEKALTTPPGPPVAPSRAR
jgi:hypothetical protein